jgi:hypothetical protein
MAVKKKQYKRYLKNQKLRRDNPNIRKIRNGKAVSFWSENNVERPVSAF